MIHGRAHAGARARVLRSAFPASLDRDVDGFALPCPRDRFVRCWPGARAPACAVSFARTAFAVLTGIVMIRLEDEELRTRFGAEYALYRERVPAVLPRIGR